MDDSIYNIARIIADHLSGKISPADHRKLEEWLASAPEHKEWLKSFSQYSFLERKYIADHLSDRQKAYRKFVSRQQKYTTHRRIIRWTSGIAAILILGIGFYGLWHTFPQEKVTRLSSSQSFSPDKNIVTLTLDDGQQLQLDGVHPDTTLSNQGITLNSKEHYIQYQNTKHSTEEIQFNRLNVPRKGEYKLILADGTRVWLNSESQLTYPVTFPANERRIKLEGEAYFEVEPDKTRPFIVEIQNTAIQVLGTSFNVKAYSDEDQLYTTLVEGSVKISNGEQHTILKPEEQGIVNTTTGEIKKQKVDIRLYTSWKDGRFIFEGQNLEEIMKTLERWYDVKAVFLNEKAKYATSNGDIERYKNVEIIINMLEMTGIAQFDIQENVIYIQ